MRRHVRQLLARHRISARLTYSCYEQAIPELREVRFQPIRGPWTYLIALHEIGHVVCKHKEGSTMHTEAAAWQWAVSHSKVPVPYTSFLRIATFLMGHKNA